MTATTESPIDPHAQIAPDAQIGPYCVVGPHVTIGAGTRLISNVTLMGRVTIGRDNVLYPGVAIGGEPQDRNFRGSDTGVIIGDHNLIRESVTLHRGSDAPPGVTSMGNNCYLMACSHVGHDCRLGDNVVLVNGALLGAHVHVMDHATLSGGAVVHPRTTIGEYSFISGLSRVVHDVPPYLCVDADRATPRGVNVVALRRNGFPEDVVAVLADAYRLIYREKMGLDEIRESFRRNGRLVPQVTQLLSFVEMQQEGRHGRAREVIRSAA
jgi:UDP-N-acetylglucosamine acyltransferase